MGVSKRTPVSIMPATFWGRAWCFWCRVSQGWVTLLLPFSALQRGADDGWGFVVVLGSSGPSFACRGLLGLESWDRTLQKYCPAIVAFSCIQLNSHRRSLHMSVIALIKYPSLMPLYIYSVSLETHKASFSDLCDETSLHYLPGTLWRNKRPIEQSFEMNKYGKRGE